MMITCGSLQRFGSSPSVPDAAGDHHADVAVLDAVDGQRVVDRLGHFGLGHGDFQPDGLGRVPGKA